MNRRRLSQLRYNIIACEYQREKRYHNKKASPDAILRSQIYKDLKDMISAGKGKVETLDFLYNRYKDQKLSIYFSQWYDHFYAKLNKEKDSKGMDDER